MSGRSFDQPLAAQFEDANVSSEGSANKSANSSLESAGTSLEGTAIGQQKLIEVHLDPNSPSVSTN